jgi:catechol 2,3-dioxygenase-like lactoylglutathione lyase family enzyme
MAGQGFHHVAIRAIDFDATLKFYAEGLGCAVRCEFSVPGRIDRAAFLDMGDGRYIEVFGPGSAVQSEGRRRRPDEELTDGALLHFCFRVADVEAAYSRALTAGAVSRISPMTAKVVGGEIAFVTGPNGEVIEFLRSEQL